MEAKKLLLYYGLEEEVIGVRHCCHDWQEGDVIKDSDSSERILETKNVLVNLVFWGTEKIMEDLLDMFRELNTAISMKGSEYYFADEPEILDYCRCTPYTVKKRVWGDYGKRLDFVERFISNHNLH